MDTVKTYIREDNHVTIVCPECSQPKNILVESIINKRKLIKVRCSCGHVFNVEIDYRRFYRKPTSIAGTYRSLKPASHRTEDIHIVNLSKGGAGFKVFSGHALKKGYILVISFELNDKKNTYLQKEVTVQSVEGDYIGCRFSDPDLFEKALGFYLQS